MLYSILYNVQMANAGASGKNVDLAVQRSAKSECLSRFPARFANYCLAIVPNWDWVKAVRRLTRPDAAKNKARSSDVQRVKSRTQPLIIHSRRGARPLEAPGPRGLSQIKRKKASCRAQISRSWRFVKTTIGITKKIWFGDHYSNCGDAVSKLSVLLACRWQSCTRGGTST